MVHGNSGRVSESNKTIKLMFLTYPITVISGLVLVPRLSTSQLKRTCSEKSTAQKVSNVKNVHDVALNCNRLWVLPQFGLSHRRDDPEAVAFEAQRHFSCKKYFCDGAHASELLQSLKNEKFAKFLLNHDNTHEFRRIRTRFRAIKRKS